MTYNKKQGIRLYSLLEDYRVGLSGAEIMHILDIKKTAFHDALRYLREEMGFTIYEPRQGDGYRLDDKDKGHINIGEDLLLSKIQLMQLYEKITLLDKMTNTQWVNEDSISIAKKLGKAVDSESFTPSMIEIIEQHVRKDDSYNLIQLIEALKAQSTIRVDYQSRSSLPSVRTLSPQKLVYFQSNWYLVAFCHKANTSRFFAVENLANIATTTEDFKQMTPQAIEKTYAETYGIFGDDYVEDAIIIFNRHIKQWVQDEMWHKKEKKRELSNGNLELTVPIGENLMGLLNDLMRYADCIVDISPPRLKDGMCRRLDKASKNLVR